MHEVIYMSDKICADCVHFVQHYRKHGKHYDPINCGHCIALRVKKRQALDTPCEHFQENSPAK